MTKPDRRPTIKEVARHAGVALSSVSRVLNDHPDATPQMRERVWKSIHELGYEPDLVASSLRSGTSRTIGFIVADIVNPLFAEILRGAEHRLRDEGYSVLLTHSRGDADHDIEGARLLRRRRVDGLIISLADEQRPETLTELGALDVPVVLLDREVDGDLPFSAVLADHQTGLRRATAHLLDLGHRDIALITGPLQTRPGRERAEGFRAEFAARGLSIDPSRIVHGPFTHDFGERSAAALLSGHDRPTAIIAGGNLILVGVIAALHQHALKIGTDVALITCDDVPLAKFHTPPITVVARDTTRMGDLAARLLLDQLRDGQAPRIEHLATDLLVRQSTFRLQ